MKTQKWITFSLIATLVWSMVATLATPYNGRAAGVLYAAPAALGSGDCSGWENACSLQTALGNAVSSDEIWIMQGVHIPGAAPTDTFILKNSVALYGGFTGVETSLAERDWETNPTVLSGDIDNNDITDPAGVVTDVNNIVGTNAYHVVTGSGTVATAVLDGLVITAGQDYLDNGAGMYNIDSSPSLTNVIFSGNRSYASGGGGGLFNNNSSPTLTNVTFRNNNAWYGGGMYNISSDPVLTNVTFNGNSAGYGGGMNNQDSSPTLTNVTFAANTAANEGGGMRNVSSDPTLTSVSFTGNSAGKGGGMYNETSEAILTEAIFSNNTSTLLGYGGAGLYIYQSTLTLTNGTFSGNSTSQWGAGAGIYADFSTLNLSYVRFADNTADDGGGGLSSAQSNATLMEVSFSNNSADHGGGMYVYEGTAELTNVTFADNSALYDGGGMYNYSYYFDTVGIQLNNVTFSGNSAGDEGGGMHNYGRNIGIHNVTFTGNSAPYGGGIYVYYGHALVINSIMWDNTVNQVYLGSNGTANIIYSVIQGGWMGEGIISQNPLLGELADNGGYTMTHALLAGSPAIDTGSNDRMSSATDQRGYARPYDGDGNGTAVCDMGTFEVQPYTLTINTIGDGEVVASPDNPTYNYGDVVTLTATAEPHWTFSGWSGDASGAVNPLTVTIRGNTSITATFIGDEHTLEIVVAPPAGGSVTRSPDQPTYHYGDTVTLTPSANPGWTFSGWSGDASGADSPLVVTIQGDTSITAGFTQDEYTLEVAVDPSAGGTVTRSPDQLTYHYGDTVTLTPSPNPGWTFSGWSGDASGADSPLVVTIQGDTSITAGFTQDEYTLDVAVDPSAGGTVTRSPDQPTYQYGDTVTLTPTANAGWTFSGWSGDASGADDPLVVTIQGDTSITAMFTADETTIFLYLPAILKSELLVP